MKSITKRIISTLAICGALVLEAGATAIGSLGKALNNIAKVDAASKTSTLTFTAACGGSGTASDGVSWKVESDASESQFDGTKGIHYGTGKIAVSYLRLSTSGISGTIKSIVVNASGGSKTAAQVGVTVNGSDFGTSQSLTASAAEYTFSGSATGSIIVSITQASKALALYCKSIAVTYEEAAANQLATPTNIAYSNGTLTWGAVEHATGYKVSVNGGTASTVTTNSKSIALNNTDSVSVIATDSTAAYTDSSAGTFKYINYGTESEPIPVSDALKIAALHTNADVTDLAYVKGKLTENPTNTTYGNFHISDDGTSSNSLYVYGVTATTSAVSKSGNYWSFSNPKDFGTNGATKDLKSQDEAIFKLRLYNYSGTMEGDGLFVKMYVVKTNVDITGSDVAIKVGDDDVAPTTNVTGYTLTSNNTSIVSIVNNKIHAVAEGNTTVTISKTEDNEHTYTSKTINVTVSAATEPYITPDKTAASGYTGTSEEVGVSYGNLLGTFSATSGNPSVATVSIKSNLSGKAVLTIGYVAAGNATISLKDGANELATIAVSVSLSTVTISGMPATNSVYIDKTLDLGSLITVTPTGSCGNGVTWSTTDGGKATVDSNGVVTGVAAGTTTITATPNDYSAGAVSCTVTVSEAPLETTYDFVTNFSKYVENWGNTDKQSSYLDRTISYESLRSEYDATISLHYASKQGSTITTMPVFATKTGSGSYTDVLDFTLNETDYTISHIAVTFVQWGSKTPDVALFSGTGASGTALDSITINGTTLSLDADVKDLTSFSIGYCDKNTGSNVQAGIASIDLQFKAKKSLTSIAVSESHRSFDNGAEFVKETVTAHYSDSTSPIVSGATFKIKKDLEGSVFADIPETLDMSYNNATVQVSYSDSYGSASTSYTINVHYAAATDVELNPTSADVEKGKTFDLSDVAVTISPSTANPKDYKWSIKDKTEVSDSTLVGNTFTAGNDTGKVTLTCTSGSASADFVINVVDEPVPQLTGFTAEGTPSKATQYRNATFALDLTDITLKAVYDIKDPETIGSDQFNWDTTGTHPIGTYILDEDLTVTVDSITLADDFINSISFTASSDMSKKEYWVGDSWDFAGLAIEGKWISGADLDVDSEKVSFTTTSTTAAAGEGLSIVVTAHYEGFEGTEPTLTVSGITIRENEMESLTIDYTGGNPELGEDFVFAGTITGNMSNGDTQPVDIENVTIDPVNKFTQDEQTINVTHNTTGATGSFKVTYVPKELPEIVSWERCDSVSDLLDGGTFIIGYEATAKSGVLIPMMNSGSATTSKAGYMYSGGSDGGSDTITMSTVTTTNDYEVTIGESSAVEGDIYIKIGENYLGNTNTKNNCKLFDKESVNTAFHVTVGENDVFTLEITANTGASENYKLLQYNSGSPRFAVYKSGQKDLVIYKKVVSHEEADLIKLNVSCSKTFKEGETLNISDLTVNGLYNDGTTPAITTGVTFSDGTTSKVLEAGDNNLIVKCGNVEENITITATPLVKYDLSVTINDDQAKYTVSPALTDGKLIGGEDYTIEVSAKAGYVIESVTASGASVSGNVVTITNASSNVSITVTSRALDTFNITYNGTNADYATITPKPSTIVEGNKLDLTVTAKDNKKIDSVVVTMGGVEQTDAYSDGAIHLDSVSGNIVITVNCSFITYEVDFSGSDENITFDPATTIYNQGAEFEVEAVFNDFLYEIDEDNSTVSMEGGGEIILIDNVIYAEEVTGKITVSIVLKDVTYTVNVAGDVHYSVTSAVPQENDTLLVTLQTDEHYVLPNYIDGYEVSNNTISIPKADLDDKSITLTTPAVLAQHTVVCTENIGISNLIITSPVDYGTKVDYVFDVLPGFVDPTDANITMTDGIVFNLSKKEDGHWHLNFTVTKNVEFSVILTATVEYDLTNATSSNTSTAIEVGTAYTTTITLPAGYDSANTTIKVEHYNTAGELVEITDVVGGISDNKAIISVPADKVTSGLVITATTKIIVSDINSIYDDDVVIITSQPDPVYEGESCTFVFDIDTATVGAYNYKFDKATSSVLVNGVNIIDEDGVWNVDSDTLTIVISNPKASISITVGLNQFEYSLTGNNLENATVGVGAYHLGDTNKIYYVYANEHYYFDGELVLEVMYAGNDYYTTLSLGADYSLVYDENKSTVSIKIPEIQGNYRVTVATKHDKVSATTGTLSNITFDFTSAHENVDHLSQITGKFTADFGYLLPNNITVTCYGEVLTINKDYTYNSDTGVFSMYAMGDIVISATGSQGKVEFSLVNTNEEGKATLKTHLDPELDSGYTIDNKLVAPEGYVIDTVVVTMGGNVIKNAYDASTGGVYVYSISDDVVITVTTRALVDYSITATGNGVAHSVTTWAQGATVTEGAKASYTFKAAEGYDISVTATGAAVTYSNGVYTVTITNASSNVVITVTATAKEYAVTYNLENATCSGATTVTYGGEFNATIAEMTGYTLEGAFIEVKMNGQPVQVVDGVIDIDGVTGPIVITVRAVATQVNITYTLNGVANVSNRPSSVAYGSKFETTVTFLDGYKDLVVKVNGVVDQYYDSETGVISIANVTGAISIETTATRITYEVDASGVNNAILSGASSIDFGGSYEATLSPDVANGYDSLTNVVVKMADSTGAYVEVVGAYVDGRINIELVTGDIKVLAEGVEATFTITTDLVNVELAPTPLGDYKYSQSYSGTITFNAEGYNAPTIVVTVDGVEHPEFVDGYVITITNVSGNVEISAIAEGKQQEVEIIIDVENISLPGIPEDIKYGDLINTIVVVEEGYVIDDVRVFINEDDVTDLYVIHHEPTKASRAAMDEYYEIKDLIAVPGIKIFVESSPVNYEVDVEGLENVVSTGSATATHAASYVAQLKPAEGYENVANIVVYMVIDGVSTDITATAVVDNYIFISKVTGDITISASASIKHFSIQSSLTHASNSNDAISADYGTAYNATIAPETGYTNLVVTVMMSGVDVTADVYSNGVISIAKVTGEIQITASAELSSIAISYNLSNVSSSTDVSSVMYNEPFEATFTVNEGYFALAITVTMGGEQVTVVDGHFAIEHVTGEIVINASATKIELQTISAVANVEEIAYGGTFTAENVTVTGHYNDGVDRKIDSSLVTIEGFVATKVGEQEITVKVGELDAKITISVKASEEIQSITAVVVEGKEELEYNAPFTVDDVVVTATYTDGHTAVVAADNVDFAGTVGENTVTVHVGDKTCEVSVTVKASEVIDYIEVSTDKPTVVYGGSFTKDDVKVTYVYTDGHKVEGQKAESISEFNNRGIGIQDITVTAAGKTAVLKVTVDGHVITSLELKGYDEYVDQNKEYTFNGSVTAHYADGSTEVIATGYEVSKLDTSKHGQQKATVTYAGVSAEFTVNVIQTETQLEPYAATAVAGGAIVGVAAISVGLFFLFKKFKI